MKSAKKPSSQAAKKKVPKKDNWHPIHTESTKEALQKSFKANLQFSLAKDPDTVTAHDKYKAFAMAVRDRVVERWTATRHQYQKENKKRVYYLSLEFLIGRLLGNNLINLDMWEAAREALKELNLNLDELLEEESDAGLGNGGLGRLAACFLDSMATLKIPTHGYGIRYEYGIFNQKIVNGKQVETPDEWLKNGNPWEFVRPEYTVPIQFYGEVQVKKEGDRTHFEWVNTQNVEAVPYDTPVAGYKNDTVNTLRLWAARSSEEFDLDYFNDGDYEKAVYNKIYSENISKVLYPNDANAVGRELRLKQEYFFTAASIADIIRRFKVKNRLMRNLPDKVAIQLNDTHPALAVAEFMRVLLDKECIEWDDAWQITTQTFAYTNHTVLPEALECWSAPLFEKMLPRHAQIVYEINRRFIQDIKQKFPKDTARIERMSIVREGTPKSLRMAHLAIVGSHSVNGVSELHSDILKDELFRDFYEIYPNKFNNKTNGVTQRRWLLKSNRRLSQLITDAIGDKWVGHLEELKKLEPFRKDSSFCNEWKNIKLKNKEEFSQYVQKKTGIQLVPESLFDVQIKRIHEYKRQALFGFYILSEYLNIKDGLSNSNVPRTFLVSGKAAPGYYIAKLIIKMLNSIGEMINHDASIHNQLKVVFLENYGVSLAEKIFPAADLSEQISTAGMEASGTGCMKFMMNGALTIGTLDGANIEMCKAMGAENMFTFGLDVAGVKTLKAKGYDPQTFIRKSERLQRVLSMLEKSALTPDERDILKPLYENLAYADPFLVCADYEGYLEAQKSVSSVYGNSKLWTQKAILNVARSGVFSSDRTIKQYAKEIWGTPIK